MQSHGECLASAADHPCRVPDRGAAIEFLAHRRFEHPPVLRMFRLWPCTTRIPTWDRASPYCWKLRRRGGMRPACELRQQPGDAPAFERLRTQRSHSRSGRGMRCNTTWRAALAAQRHIPLMALPRRGRTGLRPIPLLQSIRWIHWFESRPPEMARTTVRLLRPTR